jgi:penicillin amidase
MIWDEFDSDNEALTTPFTYQTIYLLKQQPEDAFMDIIDTPKQENAQDLFLLAFKEATKTLIEWKSNNGDYNRQAYKGTRVGHLLQGLPAFSRFDLPIGGDRSIVNATSETHGPSWRMIVEMSSPPKAFGIYPGGQSGNPGSHYYDNFIDDWAVGKYHQLNFLQNAEMTDVIMATQTLTPSK